MIVLGRIVAPFGVHGWVKIHPFGDEPEAWFRMSQWWLAVDPDGLDWQPYALQEASLHGKGLVAKFVGVDGRDAAEAIDGCFIGAPRLALPENAADEYYWADLVGLDVVNQEGERLGRVTSLLSSGAHDVICVREGERERLLPFVARVVKSVDVRGGMLRVDWGADW